MKSPSTLCRSGKSNITGYRAIRHNNAQINNINLHYVSEGEGELVLFLHGFPEFWYGWRGQISELGKDYHAVAPDMRGYNLSDKPDSIDEYKIIKLVEDIRALIGHLGHEKCYLVGHDWGGVVAWAFAMRHPEYLNKLVIINSPHPAIFARELGNNKSQQAASRYIRTFRSAQAEDILSADNYAKLKQSYINADNEKEYTSAWSQPGALTAMLNYYRANDMLDTSGYDSLIVNVPTMVIWGEQDTALLTGNLDGLGEYVPDLTVRRIPGASHWVVHEQPDVVSGYIREFLG